MCLTDVCFRLLNRRHIQEGQYLAQVMIGAKTRRRPGDWLTISAGLADHTF